MSKHEEFPRLTPEAWAARDAGIQAIQSITATISPNDLRRCCAAFLREAMNQARDHYGFDAQIVGLEAIADSLYSPPPPPTLAQARAADLDTQDGIETVRAFLATLEEGGQP
jgi:hypothetical protein